MCCVTNDCSDELRNTTNSERNRYDGTHIVQRQTSDWGSNYIDTNRLHDICETCWGEHVLMSSTIIRKLTIEPECEINIVLQGSVS